MIYSFGVLGINGHGGSHLISYTRATNCMYVYKESTGLTEPSPKSPEPARPFLPCPSDSSEKSPSLASDRAVPSSDHQLDDPELSDL